MNLKAIAAKMNDYHEMYDAVGLRVQDVPFELGACDHVSRVWDDNEETEIELAGLCALMVGDIHRMDNYFGDHVAIVCGYEYEYGEDIGEIIICDPVVVEIIK